jgi:hypothetical protein
MHAPTNMAMPTRRLWNTRELDPRKNPDVIAQELHTQPSTDVPPFSKNVA